MGIYISNRHHCRPLPSYPNSISTMPSTTAILESHLPTPKHVVAKGSPLLERSSIALAHNLSQLLARASTTAGRLTLYTSANKAFEASQVSYSDLLNDAKHKAGLLGRIGGLFGPSTILLHLTASGKQFSGSEPSHLRVSYQPFRHRSSTMSPSARNTCTICIRSCS